MSSKIKIIILSTVTIICIVTVFSFPPIPQNPTYHHFADTETKNNIPNAFNVLSNLPFLLFGIMGIILVWNKSKYLELNQLIFFIGIFFTGIGSSVYHLNPCNQTLVWDRLPMTISFMSFLSIIISEYIDKALGKKLLIHFIFVGILSVVYWYQTELKGVGDLRFYALIQFMPIVITPLIILLFNNTSSKTYLLLMLVIYLMAKLCERFDQELFLMSHFISGHSLKHFLASMAPLPYIIKLKQKL